MQKLKTLQFSTYHSSFRPFGLFDGRLHLPTFAMVRAIFFGDY